MFMDSASRKKKVDDVTDAQMEMDPHGMHSSRNDKQSTESMHIPNDYPVGARKLDRAVEIIDLNSSPPMVGEEEEVMDILNDYPGASLRLVNEVDIIDVDDSPTTIEEGVASSNEMSLTNFEQPAAPIQDEESPMHFDDFPEVPASFNFLMGGSGDARPPPHGRQTTSFSARNSKIHGR
ncbi:uncharacterized protein LOC123405973 [Hordeum vulgare subsp. vulgare]|uniref:uncharacterized protein LOC123405973 n=1 Tax=Hordeum vulgare subsp. vulgare TaxID=112509 RepID=UPI001D1A4C59|nr:uncharacterized protein LOC123405973 [Hordeum vulgare subsp. vulgare]